MSLLNGKTLLCYMLSKSSGTCLESLSTEEEIQAAQHIQHPGYPFGKSETQAKVEDATASRRPRVNRICHEFSI